MSSAANVEAVIDSDVLLQGQREVLIRHGDRVYRLRHTSNDKLILTK
ncbi:hemin uptake protein HemP [Pseudoxanthomonas dokdonensis]|nr:hemin uptake protein HemP [Pseudoxanthomonas dokdonensis]